MCKNTKNNPKTIIFHLSFLSFHDLFLSLCHKLVLNMIKQNNMNNKNNMLALSQERFSARKFTS